MPVRILFEDEGRFGRISDKRRCWGPLPKRPETGQQVVRESVYSLAAVCPDDGGFSSLVMPWLDAETMSVFLHHTARVFPNDFCIIFMDGAGWHKANELRIPATMKILFLPPYSPELNPVEQIWEHISENYFGNRVFETLDEVEDVLCLGLKNLIENPEIVKSMTSYPWLNTLCMTSN